MPLVACTVEVARPCSRCLHVAMGSAGHKSRPEYWWPSCIADECHRSNRFADLAKLRALLPTLAHQCLLAVRVVDPQSLRHAQHSFSLNGSCLGVLRRPVEPLPIAASRTARDAVVPRNPFFCDRLFLLPSAGWCERRNAPDRATPAGGNAPRSPARWPAAAAGCRAGTPLATSSAARPR